MFGLDKLSLRFLVMSLDDVDVEVVCVDVDLSSTLKDGVVFEDAEAMAELDSEVINTIKHSITPFDIN